VVLPDAGNPQSTNKHRSAGFSWHRVLIQMLKSNAILVEDACPGGEPSLRAIAIVVAQLRNHLTY